VKPQQTPDLTPRPTDIQMIIRDGHVYLRTPQQRDAKVPQDYLVALGFSLAFLDPQFRRMMLALVNEQYDKGQLGDMIETHRPAGSTVN
jgi:hypothetical protein